MNRNASNFLPPIFLPAPTHFTNVRNVTFRSPIFTHKIADNDVCCINRSACSAKCSKLDSNAVSLNAIPGAATRNGCHPRRPPSKTTSTF